MHSHKRTLRRFDCIRAEVEAFAILPKDAKRIDQRMADLAGVKGWIRRGAAPIQRSGSMKAHDFLKIVDGAYPYIFHNIYDPWRQESLEAILQVMSMCVKATSDVGQDDERSLRESRELKYKIVSLMAVYERGFPATEFPPLFHTLVHYPDIIFRWNSTRNYWGFYVERYALETTSPPPPLHLSRIVNFSKPLTPPYISQLESTLVNPQKPPHK
jgi:hypothetical protein